MTYQKNYGEMIDIFNEILLYHLNKFLVLILIFFLIHHEINIKTFDFKRNFFAIMNMLYKIFYLSFKYCKCIFIYP